MVRLSTTLGRYLEVVPVLLLCEVDIPGLNGVFKIRQKRLHETCYGETSCTRQIDAIF
jgi:hypothetical protein